VLHPNIHVRWINESIGYGLFAHRPIAKGSVTYVDDALEIKLSEDHPLVNDAVYGPIVDRFSYLAPDKTRVISWDLAKYMNHCCFANTLTTGYGFEIAIRDIAEGEEVKDDYTLFCDSHPMIIECSEGRQCRRRVDRKDFNKLVPYWDEQIRSAFDLFSAQEQPLWKYVPSEVQADVKAFLEGRAAYRSVLGGDATEKTRKPGRRSQTAAHR
jgi:hypothetical protein